MNYYDILGVARTASQDEIKRAYREQIKFFTRQVEQLEAECADLGFPEDFLTVAVGLIWDNDPVYFHQPDCTAVNGANFSVFAEDICESVGLKPCPVCYTEEDVALIEQWKEW